MNFVINSYKAVDNAIELANYLNGHDKVLRDFGITNLGNDIIPKLPLMRVNNKINFFTAENIDEHIVDGGARVHLYNNNYLFPSVEFLSNARSIDISQDRMLEHTKGNTAEICGIWNSKRVAGYQLSNDLLKSSLALCISLKVEKVFMLVGESQKELLESIGFEIDEGLFERGEIALPKKFKAFLYSIDLENQNLRDNKIFNEIYKISNKEILKLERRVERKVFGADFLSIYFGNSNSNLSFLSQGLSIIDINLYAELVKNPDLIKSMNWRTFEKLLADMLETFGYNVELMQGTKDGGIDIVAFSRNDDFGKHKYLLQAKRWSNKVGIDVVKNVLFDHDRYKVTKSCLATTATFTKGVWDLAEIYKWQLELKDFDSIKQWINKAYQNKQEK